MTAEEISADAPDLLAALASSLLPVDDLGEPGRSFFRFTADGLTVAFGGFERYGEAALLRSIIVLPQARGQGRGSAATGLLMQRALAAGARRAYLLTTDAAPFFQRAGFLPVERQSAPAAILATRQAASLCPASAVLMARSLSEDARQGGERTP